MQETANFFSQFLHNKMVIDEIFLLGDSLLFYFANFMSLSRYDTIVNFRKTVVISGE